MKIINIIQQKISNRRTRFLLIAFMFFFGCSQEKKITDNLISPPIPSLNPGYFVFAINAEEGGSHCFANGSTVSIPPDAFIDAEGRKVSGKVYFKYREFHDAASIFLSGIPMEYEKSEVKQIFQTAGMFDIKAHQKGKDIFVDPTKNITVKLASYETGNDYNFWWLDEQNKSWEYLDRKDPEVNPKKEFLKKIIEKLRPSMKFPLDDAYFALNYNSVLDVYYNDDWQKIYNNKSNKTVNKKTKEYGMMWTSIYSGEWINFKGNEHKASLMVWKKISEAQFPKWVFSEKVYNHCSFVKISNQQYRMNVENENGRKFSAIVEVVMPLKSLFAFSPEYWKKNYDEAMQKVYEEEKKIKLEADVYRTFMVNKLGIYNYDKFLKEENKVLVNAVFNCDKSNQCVANAEMIFCIPEDNKSLIKYPKQDWDKVVLLPGNKARFITVMSGSDVAVYTAERYQRINFDSLKNQTKPNYKFTLMSNSQSIKSEDDLRKLLGI